MEYRKLPACATLAVRHPGKYSQSSQIMKHSIMAIWQLQAAKARLSEVVKKAATDGPQHITLHGEPAAVVLSAADYARLQKKRDGFAAFIARSPLRGVELDLTRDRSRARDVRL